MAVAKKGAAPKAAPKAAPVATATAPAPAAPVADHALATAAAEVAQLSTATSADDAGSDDTATAETIKPAEGEVFVLVAKGLERFHRCGMRFTREPTVLVIADLDEGVLERLESEPSLVVVKG